MTHDPLTRYLLLLCDRLLWQENSGRLSPDVGPGHKHLKFLTQKLEKRINKHINVIKICMIFVPLFSQDTPMEWTPESEMIFIFQKVKPTWNQPDLSSVYVAACFLHLRNTSFASLLGDRRDLVGLIIRPLAEDSHCLPSCTVQRRAAKQAVAELQTNRH